MRRIFRGERKRLKAAALPLQSKEGYGDTKRRHLPENKKASPAGRPIWGFCGVDRGYFPAHAIRFAASPRKKRIKAQTQWDFFPFAHDAPVFSRTHMRFRQNYGGLCHTRSRNISLSASLAGAPFPICAAQARRLCPKQPVRLALSHNPKP